MFRFNLKFTIAALAFLFGMGVFPATIVAPGDAHAATCKSLSKEFKTKVRPQFLRVAKRNRKVATYFRSELNRIKSSSSPTRSEIQRAYRKTRTACRNASCRRQASQVLAATNRIFRINQRWSRAGCPGTLS